MADTPLTPVIPPLKRPPIALPDDTSTQRSPVAAPLPPVQLEPVAQPKTFDALPPVEQQRISANVKALRANGATDVGVHQYLQEHEGLTPVAPKPTQGSGVLGALESGTQGLLGGFADEIGGAGAAGIDALDNIAHGQPANFQQNYKTYRDTARNLDQDYATAHPVGHAVAEIAGAALPAVLTAGASLEDTAPSLIARMGKGALGGALSSAVYGAGNANGDLSDRLSGAVKALPSGAVLGGAFPLAATAVGAIPKIFRAISGTGVGTRAFQKLAETVGNAGLTPDAIAADGAAQQAAGSPVKLVDLMGDPGRRLGWWTGAQPSPGGTGLLSSLRDRMEGQYDRILSGTKTAAGQGFTNIPQTVDALLQQRRTNAQPAYNAAYSQPDFSSPTIDAAMQSPSFRKAIDAGRQLAYQDDLQQAIKNGTALPKPPAKISPIAASVDAAPVLGSGTSSVSDNEALWTKVLATNGNNRDAAVEVMNHLGAKLPKSAGGSDTGGGLAVPIKVLDYAKRYLDGGIRSGFDGQSTFNRTTAQSTNGLLGSVLDDVDSKVPEYAKARSLYHSDSRMLDAVDLGQSALTMPPDELAYHVNQLSPSARDVFQASALDAFKKKAGTVADRNDLSKQFLTNPAMRSRFQQIVPDPDSYSSLEALRDREGGMARTLDFMQGGSQTADKQLMDQSMNGTIRGSDLGRGVLSPRRVMMAVAGRVGGQLQARANAKLADQLAPILGSEPGSQTFSDALSSLGPAMKQNANRSQFQQALAQVLGARNGLMRGNSQ